MRTTRRLSLILALALGGAAIGFAPAAAVAAPDDTDPGPGPLPACAYDQVLTPQRDYVDWRRTLLDTELKLGKTYAPSKLVSVHEAGIAGIGKVRPFVIADLAALHLAARAAGHPIEVSSAYRSFDRQKELFDYWVDHYGMKKALATSARAGHSEHQLGTTLDLKAKGGKSPWNVDDWGATPTGAWLAKHAWEFGFVMSYPKGKRNVTCYAYEPWHYRYYGRTRAAAIHFSGLTAREWLWQHGYGS